MEEGNIKEHRNYLEIEEEKRKRARLVRTTVEGPLLRVVSKAEKVTVKIQPPMPPPLPLHSMPTPYPYLYPSSSQASASYSQPPLFVPMPAAGYYGSPPQYSAPPTAFPQMAFVHHQHGQLYAPPGSAPGQPAPVSQQSFPPPPPPEPIERIETVMKNYVIHENGQDEDATRPLWKDTMTAMFGDHVNWEGLKVYTVKGRPMSKFLYQCWLLMLMTDVLQVAPRRAVR
jgi:hypothetical protein